ncbi:hypothetical protein ASD54_12360 [Rhizobium sp. Root149]|nr:hypothetical protein ASD54_12360 [Rhizobium sp. Root149]
MKIIKQGIDPKSKVYIGECISCGTVIEFQRHEAQKETFDQRDGSWMLIGCPTCKKGISVAV